jgi:hypothetical protein
MASLITGICCSGSNNAGKTYARVASSRDLVRKIKSWRQAALNASRTRWHRPSFIAEGSNKVMNLATSELCSISVTKDNRGTF